MAAIINGTYGTHILPEGYSTLGRGSDCDIQIDDPRLSRHHARFFYCEGQLQIEDMNSHNGILVNGETVHALLNLFDGNVIAIGPAVYHVAIDESINTQKIVFEAPTQVTIVTPTHVTADHEHNRHTTTQALARQTTASQESDFPDESSTAINKPSSEILPATSISSKQQALTSRRENKPESKTPYDFSEEKPSSEEHYAPADSASDQPTLAVRHDGSVNTDDAPQQDSNASDTVRERQMQALSERKEHGDSDKDGDSDKKQLLHQFTPDATHTHTLSHTAISLKRLAATFLDSVHNITIIVVLCFPLLSGGYYIALQQNNATSINGLPSFDAHPTQLNYLDCAQSLTTSAGWQRAWQLSADIYTLFPQSFMWIFSALVSSLLVIMLILLYTLVAATSIKGAPFWHRTCGLRITETQNGFYPTPLRSCARWTLALTLAPLALLCSTFNIRSPHDYLSGCQIKHPQ